MATMDKTKQIITNMTQNEIKGLIKNYKHHKWSEKYTARKNAG